MKLPPIPEPRRCDVSMGTHRGELVFYSADQVRAYGEACALMAREDAAKVCDRIAVNYRRDQPNDPSGFLTAEECAAAIRKG